VIYETIKVEFQDTVCFLQIDRPEANNTINGRLIAECNHVLSVCEDATTVVVLSGSPEVFCFGADFKAIAGASKKSGESDDGPGPLYDLWLRLATGPYITISHVRGKANAGGIGFVAASDIVLNLRYPTVGENSGTLMRALGLGKAVIVSEVGSFSELPSGVLPAGLEKLLAQSSSAASLKGPKGTASRAESPLKIKRPA